MLLLVGQEAARTPELPAPRQQTAPMRGHRQQRQLGPLSARWLGRRRLPGRCCGCWYAAHSPQCHASLLAAPQQPDRMAGRFVKDLDVGGGERRRGKLSGHYRVQWLGRSVSLGTTCGHRRVASRVKSPCKQSKVRAWRTCWPASRPQHSCTHLAQEWVQPSCSPPLLHPNRSGPNHSPQQPGRPLACAAWRGGC